MADDFGISTACAFQAVARVIDAFMNVAKFSLPARGRPIDLNKEKFFRMAGSLVYLLQKLHRTILGCKPLNIYVYIYFSSLKNGGNV